MRAALASILLATLAVAGAGGPAVAATSTATSTPTATGAERSAEAWFWRWTDGSRDRTRSLAARQMRHGAPTLTVTVQPPTAGRVVVLQVRTGAGWRVEDAARTSARGVAVVQVNPFCPDGDWCRGTEDYRLLAGGRTALLSVRFSAARAS